MQVFFVLLHVEINRQNEHVEINPKIIIFKDSASFCYCPHVLRISEYSGFLRNLLTNTTIKNLLHYCISTWFMTMWKKQILASAIRIQKENWG